MVDVSHSQDQLSVSQTETIVSTVRTHGALVDPL